MGLQCWYIGQAQLAFRNFVKYFTQIKWKKEIKTNNYHCKNNFTRLVPLQKKKKKKHNTCLFLAAVFCYDNFTKDIYWKTVPDKHFRKLLLCFCSQRLPADGGMKFIQSLFSLAGLKHPLPAVSLVLTHIWPPSKQD